MQRQRGNEDQALLRMCLAFIVSLSWLQECLLMSFSLGYDSITVLHITFLKEKIITQYSTC